MSYNAKNYTEQGGERTVIGGEIEIVTGGKLKIEGDEVTVSTYQADSQASELGDLVADFNALLAKLRQAGIMKDE